jgi:hypothetical protein
MYFIQYLFIIAVTLLIHVTFFPHDLPNDKGEAQKDDDKDSKDTQREPKLGLARVSIVINGVVRKCACQNDDQNATLHENRQLVVPFVCMRHVMGCNVQIAK